MDLLFSKTQPTSGSSTGSFGISTEQPGSTLKDCSSSTLSQGVMERYEHFVKSEADKRVYRGLLLTNRLKVLLVSDPTIDVAAAAVEVQVGSFSDPDEIPGLAHFCEHMVFLGTKKYPQENDFDKFLTENGGWNNAMTRSDSTIYYFSVPPPHLNKSLDMFAQFFVAPLFTESATDRELNAVNAEHENNVSCDFWRLYQLPKQICDVTHPFHKFSTGNKETLQTIPESTGINVREELLKFHDKWYSANIMSLVVIGKESLNDLEATVAHLFSSIENKSVIAPFWPKNPFPSELCRKKVYGIPIKDIRTLEIDFPIPYTLKYYKSKPAVYLARLIEHEGPGSLLSALKNRGWSNSLSSWKHMPARGFGYFYIELDLTVEGINHVDDIITLFFQYIAMLKWKGPQQWIWEESKNQREMDFRFKDAMDPVTFVTDYVDRLQQFPIEDVLSVYSLNPEWNPELIKEILSFLIPENMNVYIVAQTFEDKCTLTVPRYGNKYCVEDIDESKLKEWKEVELNEELHLPAPNDFIPSKLALDESIDPTCKDIAPAIIKDTKLMRVWYKKDDEFQLPKAFITFDLISPWAFSEPVNANLTAMLVENLNDSLTEITYSAALAGLSWSILRNAPYGISINVDGYDDKIHLLLNMILDHLIAFKVEPKRFEIKTEGIIRCIKNAEANAPTALADREEDLCLSSVSWNMYRDVEAIQGLTPKQLEEFAANFIRKVHIEGLMYGNLSRERAIKIADLVEEKFPKDGTPLLAEQLLLNRVIELDKGVWYVREIQTSVHRSSCASLYYGCGENEARENMMLCVFANLLSEPCYTTLRTQEQLGYIVQSTSCHSNGSQGLRITVQSDKHPYFLEQRIEEFVQGFLERLQNMSDEEFLKHKEAVTSRILEKPKQMSTMFWQLWAEIAIQVYNFDRDKMYLEHLKAINKEDTVKFYKKHFSVDSPDRQKLSVYVVSTAEGGAGNEKTEYSEEEQDINNLRTQDIHENERDKTDEKKQEEVAPDEKEIVKNLLKDLDENKNEENKIDKTDLEGNELDTKDATKNKLGEKPTSEQESSEKKPCDISTFKSDKEKHFSADSSDSQKLSVYVVSTAEGGAGNENTEHPEKEQEQNKISTQVIPVKKQDETDEKIQKEVEVDKKEGKKIDENNLEDNKLDAKDPNENESEGKVENEQELNEKKPCKIPTLKGDKKPEIITDLLEFKSRRRLYPMPKQFLNIPRKGAHS